MTTVLSAAAVFLFTWLVLRSMGKRELSEMSAFDLVLLFIIGDLVAEAIIREDTSLTTAGVAVATLAVLTTLVAWIAWRFPRTRPLLEGLPTIIIRRGSPDSQMLDIERLSRDDLLEAAREKGITDLNTVELAVLEPDGSFSFFEKKD